MAITVTFTKTSGLNETFSWSWDDATMDRLLAWAKATYPTSNPDGTTSVPTDTQALRRSARSFIQALRDAIKRRERDAAVAAMAPPADIVVT